MIYRIHASIIAAALVLCGLVSFNNCSEDSVFEKVTPEGRGQFVFSLGYLTSDGLEIQKSDVHFHESLYVIFYYSCLSKWDDLADGILLGRANRGIHFSRGPPLSA